MQDRVKPLKTIMNFRDFGGYDTIDGRKLKRDKLFRSAHLNNLNDEELSQISDMKIGLVVDLRHKPERERQPSRYPVADEARVLVYGDPPESESLILYGRGMRAFRIFSRIRSCTWLRPESLFSCIVPPEKIARERLWHSSMGY